MHAIAVLPSTAGHRTAQRVFAALRHQRLSYDVLTVAELARSQPAARCSMTVALVRGLDASTTDLLRTIRRLGVPALLVVEELSEEDEVTLLHHGAYDVVSARDSHRLIGARLRTMYHHVHLRRPTMAPLQFDNLTLLPDRHEVLVDGRTLNITRTEFRLLTVLAEHPEELHDRETLGRVLGRDTTELTPRALESHVSRLRLKICSAGGPRLIEAVRGSGYRLRPPA